ncbi:conserved unknown protein [Ectocarpus siliculosus]|uniref:Cilia- and flagella-associated protein 36 n=1 Tax=Ectocarpus siliculosus TaxID=2880 RepID=D8LLX9_ECTSI|nr:conserved unknown protein [Ectocarpus siliculosus]|eukprot:CBN77193.1 conserved unknown protein [Ectocarpus siliculosus]
MPKTHDGGGRDASDTEWLFDFLLSVFKSPSWDLAVMGFIDENCAVFDTEEENKLSYTTLHRQFKDLVETLCANSLAEVGVAVGDFVDALEASRFSQDISTAVYQQLLALDDFVTFKKLMVKRNVELELEAVHALQKQGVPIQHGIEDSGVSGDEELAGNGEEKSMSASNGESKRDKAAARPGRGRSALDRQLRKAMDANLQELELMHKREEVEQAELEQAIAMSLALEAKRSEQATLQECLDGVGDVSGPRFGSVPTGSQTGKSLQAGCKGGDDPDGDGDRAGGGGVSRRRQSKERDAARELADVADDAPAEAKRDFIGEGGGAEEKHRSSSSSSLSCLGGLKKGTGAKALPPLSKTPVVGEIVAPFRGGSGEGVEGCSISSSTATMIRDPDVESAERRREARAASEKARKFLEERRQAQKALKAQSEVSEEDSAQRERHLKNMRDRIVSAKRAGREEEASKAASDSAAAAERGERAALPRTGGISTSSSPASGAAAQGSGRRADGGGDAAIIVNGEGVEEDFADEQRRMMRVALARHMKRELLESEQERLTKVQADQLADLNGKLRLVEKLRNENSEREAEIAAALRQQQRQRARNVATSAATARGGDEEFTFGETS